MSGHTWKLIDWFKENKGKSSVRLAINSNLGSQVDIDRLIESVAGLNVEIYTSMESTGSQAEYIRDGLDYAQWLDNMHTLFSSNTVKALHVMCTINALCLSTLPALLDQLVGLKRTYGRERVNFTLNILRFPSFQSALVLPDELRNQYRDDLATWLAANGSDSVLHEHEMMNNVTYMHTVYSFFTYINTISLSSKKCVLTCASVFSLCSTSNVVYVYEL